MTSIEGQVAAVRTRVEKLEKTQVENLEQSKENARKLERLSEDTQQIIDFFDTITGGMHFFFAVGRFAKWATGILVFVAAAIGIYKGVRTGEFPTIKFD